MTAEHLIERMQMHLTIDLAPPKWQRLAKKFHITKIGFGCCYPAAEVLYHVWGKANGFKPCYTKANRLQHWFLRHPDGRVADPTACQFTEEHPITAAEYAAGTNSGFLTKYPSKRARLLMKRIGL